MRRVTGQVFNNRHFKAGWAVLSGCLLAIRLASGATNHPAAMAINPRHLIQLPAGMISNPVPTLVDAGDQYTLPNGQAVRLLRSPEEVVVRYADGKTPVQALAGLRQLPQMPSLHSIRRLTNRARGDAEVLRAGPGPNRLDLKRLSASPLARYAYPVLYSRKSGTRLLPTDEILIRLAKGVAIADFRAAFAAAGVEVVGLTGHPTLNSYRVRLIRPKTSDPLIVSRQLASLPKVVWSVPNFIRELKFSSTPDDPLFVRQQSLLNTGQNNGIPGADVSATEAWDITTGSSSITVAILDTGVDINHCDLTIAPGGSNFVDNTSDPSPAGGNFHGTACAGIAAATINNNNLVAGVAGGCRVLPIKIADDSDHFVSDDIIGSAIAYAADHADVLSNSWGGDGDYDPFIDDAIAYAVTYGRGGKGCPVFFATGNSASSWLPAILPIQPIRDAITSFTNWTGQYYIAFVYKPGTTNVSEQTARIDNVRLVDTNGYTHLTGTLADEDFEGFVPGWFLYQTDIPTWSLSNSNTFTGTGGSFSAASPTLSSPDQLAWLLTPLLNLNGSETLEFQASLSMSTDSLLYVLLVNTDGNGIGYIIGGQGEPSVRSTINYPANNPNVISVGASTDCDFRSDFSQYDGRLDCVAPGGGGWNGIVTTDPTGSVGSSPEDVDMAFSGTSAACPLAAGVGALILSANPGLTATEVREVIHRSCDPIGNVIYTSGTNRFYGYGRVNAFRAITEAQPNLSVTMEAAPEPVLFGSNLVYTVTVTNQGPANATDVVLTNVLPSGVIFQSASTSQGACSTNGGVIYGTLGTITNNTSATVTITVQIAAYGTITNTVSVTANAIDANLADNSASVISTIPTDSDGDGIPDAWTLLYFGHRTGLASDHSRAADDADGDGLSNLQEFLTGTNPTNSTSALRIIAITPSQPNLNIIWTGGAGTTSVVQRSSTGSAYTNNFTDISGPIVLPEGPHPVTNFLYLGGMTNGPSGFYRVQGNR